MSDYYLTWEIHFKIILVLYIILLFYLFIGNYIDNYAMLLLFIFYLIMLYMIYNYDPNSNSNKIDTFDNTDVDDVIDNVLLDPTELDMNKNMTNKQRVIKELNNNRDTEGRFYVDCHQCGRARILDDRLNDRVNRFFKERNVYESLHTTNDKKDELLQ